MSENQLRALKHLNKRSMTVTTLQCAQCSGSFSLSLSVIFFFRITAVIYVADARFRLSIPRSPFFVLVAFQINEIKVQVFTKNVQSTSSKKKTKQNKSENSVGPKSIS